MLRHATAAIWFVEYDFYVLPFLFGYPVNRASANFEVFFSPCYQLALR